MRGTKSRKLLSLVLLAGGAVLLFMGARELISSVWGQREAAEIWEEAPPAAQQPAVPDLGSAVAKLAIPRLVASWFVFEGTGEKVLRLGPGHMRGTALPGGDDNCVIAGHRDTHFRVLKDVRKGDEILATTRDGREFRYTVTNISIVKPSNTKSIQPTGTAVMNLVTCYPFYYVGPAPKRFIVEARRDGVQSASSPAAQDPPS